MNRECTIEDCRNLRSLKQTIKGKKYYRKYCCKHRWLIEGHRRRGSKGRPQKYSAYSPSRKLAHSLRSRMRLALKRNQKAGSPVADLGCSVDELRAWLASQFQEGMSWDNWGIDGWHIDHIQPLARFDLSNRQQFLKACHYTNLQPLWVRDNIKKGTQ